MTGADESPPAEGGGSSVVVSAFLFTPFWTLVGAAMGAGEICGGVGGAGAELARIEVGASSSSVFTAVDSVFITVLGSEAGISFLVVVSGANEDDDGAAAVLSSTIPSASAKALATRVLRAAGMSVLVVEWKS